MEAAKKLNWNDDRIDHFVEQVDRSFDKVDERFDRFEEQVDRRFDKVDDRIERFEAKVDNRFEYLHERLEKRFDLLTYAMIVTLAGFLAAFAGLLASTHL